MNAAKPMPKPPARLPLTLGRWFPTSSRARGVTGWMELFPTRGGTVWVSIPGTTRHADMDGTLIATSEES